MNIEGLKLIKDLISNNTIGEVILILFILVIFTIIKEKILPYIFNFKSKSMAQEISKQRLWLSEIAIKRSGDRIINHFPIKGKRKEIQAVVSDAIKRTEPFLIQILEENHFDDKSNEEYIALIDERKVDILNEMSKHMTNLYDANKFDGYSRDEWFKHNQSIVQDCYNDIEKWFWGCRSVDLKARNQFILFEIKKG